MQSSSPQELSLIFDGWHTINVASELNKNYVPVKYARFVLRQGKVELGVIYCHQANSMVPKLHDPVLKDTVLTVTIDNQRNDYQIFKTP